MSKFLGWSLIFILAAGAVTAIDQAFLFSVGEARNHLLACRIWKSASRCSKTPFRHHSEHFFLLDPARSHFLSELARTEKIERHNDYRLNASGFRVANPAPSAEAKIRVNVFGDSFTFGLFLKEREHIVAILNGMESKCEFRNYGVPAFDFRQMIRLSRDSSLVAKSDIDLFLFIYDDILRIVRRSEVHRFGRDFDAYELSGELGIPPAFPFKIPSPLLENSFLFQKLHQLSNKRFWQSINTDFVVEKLKENNREYQKQKFYFYIPVPGDYLRDANSGDLKNSVTPKIAELSLGESILKNEVEFSSLFFPGDGHPNAAGAKWIADRVMDKLAGVCRPSGK